MIFKNGETESKDSHKDVIDSLKKIIKLRLDLISQSVEDCQKAVTALMEELDNGDTEDD